MPRQFRPLLPSMALAFPLVLGACEASEPDSEQAAPPPEASAESPPATAAAAVPEADAAVPAASPIRAATPDDAIRAYYAAIDAGEFARAYRLWNHDGEASGQSFAQFRQGFAATRSTRVTISGPVESEGAAGSIYATVPVEVEAVLKDGRRQRFAGEYVLRRVNDVPGATEEQLNWHIESASLHAA